MALQRSHRPVLEVHVLGPLEVLSGGRVVTPGPGRLRALLAALALSAGRVVAMDRLAAAVWGEDPPADTRASLQTYVTRLRSALGAGAILTAPAGYVLSIAPDDVDALRFQRLLDGAAEPGPGREAERTRIEAALALWRGAPFEGVPSAWLEEGDAPRLVERYLAAVERRADLDLAAGRHGALVPQLRELAARHPLRETLWARLLVALDRGGRQAEALEHYAVLRSRIGDELGVDPGPELQAIHADLVRTRPPRPVDAGQVTPLQLPASVEGFTGRDAELAALDGLISDGDEAGRPPVIVAVTGMAGVGKSALAVHWAHRIVDRFGDGQLYANLRGFDPGGSVKRPEDVVRDFLHAMAVPARQMPADVDALAAMYRSLLAGRRMLVVLDNARDAAQVRPLLPGTPGCLAIVTSRDALSGLVAAENARPLPLDLFTVAEARRFLARRLGEATVTAEPGAVEDIIASCGRLPLALAVVAARAVIHSAFPLSALAAELRDARRSLDVLASQDAATDVRAAFSSSYRALGAGAARLFRLLGLQHGQAVGPAAAASLAGVPARQARALLVELTRAHALLEPTPGRFAAHDLMRTYAAELTHAHDSEHEREEALGRLLDHHLHTAHAAALLLQPHRHRIALAPCRPGVAVEDLADRAQALAWFERERSALLAAVEHAAATGSEAHAWQLAWALHDFLLMQGRNDELAAVNGTALRAALCAGDRVGQAHAHCGLATAIGLAGDRQDEARDHLGRALELFQALGDRAGQAGAHRFLAWTCNQQGHHDVALHHNQRALELYRAASGPFWQGVALNAIGWTYIRLGEHRRAVACCQRAVELLGGTGQPEAMALDSLAAAQHHAGDHAAAAARFREAIDRFHAQGDRVSEGTALHRLGSALQATGDHAAAAAAWRRALAILDRIDHPEAGAVRAELERMGTG